jgi:hypothetical protein
MNRRVATALAWSLWTMVIVLTAIYLAMLVINRGVDAPTGFAFRGYALVLAPPLCTCAALVASRRPANPIGWFLFAGAFAAIAQGLSGEYATQALLADPGSLPQGEFAAWLQEWVWVPAMLMITPGFVLFPDGKPTSGRWRVIAWLSLPTLAGVMVSSAIVPGSLEFFPTVENQFASEALAVPLQNVSWTFFGWVLLPASALAPILRFRRAGAEERQQLKWLALAGSLVAAAFIAFVAVAETKSSPQWSELLILAGLMAIPIAITIAILRHRLYDIDLIINRTIVYGALSILVVGTYLALVGGLGWVVRETVGQSSNELAVAGTTLVVAAMFQPARRHTQSLVDRRFYRSRYDAALILEGFQSRMRDRTDLESLRNELLAVVQGTVQPATISLWLRRTGSERPGP